MVIPYQHVATLEETPAEVLAEMMKLTQRLEVVLRKLYRPSGLNIGMNIGEAAGAGVAGHIHMHVLPRWVADSNFMAVVGETRVLPEDLAVTWQRLRSGFETEEHG
jgi:ATP adenylyltransferase